MELAKATNQSSAASELRRHAEEQFGAHSVALNPSRSEEASQRLVHELEVHKIELEMQNEELNHERAEREKMESLLGTYSELYDFAPVGYFTLDRDEIIRAVNLTGCSILGVVRSSLIGRRFGLFVTVETRPLFAELLVKVFSGLAKQDCEVELLNAAHLPLFVQIEAVSTASGQECRLALIDISARRQAEDALMVKRRKLEELNRYLEERILKAVDDLRQKDQMLILQDRLSVMGETINFVAHQWRQPLNTLGLLVQQLPLLHDMGRLSGELLKETTRKSMELIQHMSQTIDDFRNFFKPDKKQVNFPVDPVIRRTLDLVRESFKEQQITVVHHGEGAPHATGYPNEYAQVLLNILVNARDELVEQRVEDALISIRTSSEGGTSVVTISDNAGGIAEEIIDRIFDPYFSTKGPDTGTGIGLFMSKTIIEKSMGGRLTVRNSGKGAEFRIQV